MAVDLHAHSTASDGSDSPTRVIELAARARLSAIALTDHDTLEGLDEARVAADRLGIELVPGTEISCEWAAGTMHMVILFLEPGPGPLQDRLARLQQARSNRNVLIVDRLVELGVDITYDEVLEEAGGGSVGRPHLAGVMVRKGYVADIREAFDTYLANGGPAYVERERLQPAEAIRLARASGAVPVVAHPHTLGLNTSAEFSEAFTTLKERGLGGVECYYSEYDLHRQQEFVETVTGFGLLPSGGSDYHGTYKEGLDIGVGYGNLSVPDSVLDDLRKERRA